ncbi:WD40-repeat-containing domain protein [Hyaloraphidium curvatum]|nr:WD40-repeat-containing domain protein [Hyaloraphidium curvatum]
MKPVASIVPFPENAYVLHIASPPDGAHFACAGASQNGAPFLGICDTRTLQPALSLVGTHRGTITDLCFPSPTSLVSSSMDGTVVMWDLRTGAPAATVSQAAPEPEEPRKRKKPVPLPPVCSVDVSQSLLAYGTNVPDGGDDSMICLWDLRNCASPLAVFTDCHSEDVTCVRFAPHQTGPVSELASGGVDGILNLFALSPDVISGPASPEDKENESIQMTIPLDSIAQFGWASRYIWGLTTTEQMFVVDPHEGDVLLKLEDVRERTSSEYLLGCLYDEPSERLYLFAGVGGDVNGFHVNLQGVSASPDRNLRGAHTDIVRAFASIGTDAILTGGEDGRVVSWASDPRA